MNYFDLIEANKAAQARAKKLGFGSEQEYWETLGDRPRGLGIALPGEELALDRMNRWLDHDEFEGDDVFGHMDEYASEGVDNSFIPRVDVDDPMEGSSGRGSLFDVAMGVSGVSKAFSSWDRSFDKWFN